MSDLNEAPSSESKTSTWVTGEARSLQFYALRHGMVWAFSEKTRDITTAMKEAWGSELDIVTMLAVEAKPVSRTWIRFEEEYEIVDLGRNRKKARKTYGLLESQAHSERRLRERATPEVHEEIFKWAKQQKRYRKHARVSMSEALADKGLKAIFDDDFEGNLAHEVAVPVAKKLVTLLDESDLHPVDAIKKVMKGVREKSADYNPLTVYGDFQTMIRDMLWQSARPGVLENLSNFLHTAEIEQTAQNEIRDRKVTVEKLASQLAKLGFSADD